MTNYVAPINFQKHNPFQFLENPLAEKFQHKIHALVDRGILSQDGADWLICSLDPFHDQAHPIAGYPDPNNSCSLVNVYTSSLEVSKPAAAAGNWDCCVANLPMCTNMHYLTNTSAMRWPVSAIGSLVAGYQSTPPQTATIGPVTVHAADSGESVWPDDVVANWTPTNFESAATGNSIYSYGNRVIGWGIEVYNTTSPMYQQGSVTVGSVGHMHRLLPDVLCEDDDTVTADKEWALNPMSQPPATVTEAVKMANCRTWEAKEGAYMTIVLNDLENPVRYPEGTPVTTHNSSIAIHNAGYGLGNMNSTYCTRINVANTNVHYAFFYGLSNETTLRVVSRCYVETFAGLGDDVANLATPSAQYDPMAIYLYSLAVSRLPPGVPVCMNDLGDWFNMVLKVIHSAIPAVSTALDVVLPGSGTIVRAAAPIVDAASNALSNRKKKNVRGKNNGRGRNRRR